jgi:hypothetical protein
MTKKDAMQLVDDKPTMSKGELKYLINSISLKGVFKLSSVRIGDVFVHKAFNHPCLVIKKTVGKCDSYICLSLTTTPQECFVLDNLKNRFTETKMYVTNSMVVTNFQSIADNYMYTIDTKETNRIKKLFKEFMIKNL